MELAVTVDAMEHFVKTTYALEGDAPLALIAYEHINMLYSVISTEHYPNVMAIANQLSEVDQGHEQLLIAYAKACVQPVFVYF